MTQRRIYQDECPYFITTNTQNRGWFFADEKYALTLHKIIVKACKIKKFDLFAFCILPEHLHLMAQKSVSADYSRTLEKMRCDTDKQDYRCIKANPPAQRRLFPHFKLLQRFCGTPRSGGQPARLHHFRSFAIDLREISPGKFISEISGNPASIHASLIRKKDFKTP